MVIQSEQERKVCECVFVGGGGEKGHAEGS